MVNGVFISGLTETEKARSTLSEIFLFNQPVTGSFRLKCNESILPVLSVRFMHLNIMIPTRLGVFFVLLMDPVGLQ